MFFASNYFYAYQGAVNAARFDGATRALNATLEGAGAIVGALMIGFLVLDAKYLNRRHRGYLGLAVVTTITIIVWAVGLSWQVTFTRADAKRLPLINYHHADYRGKGALYFFCESRDLGYKRRCVGHCLTLSSRIDYFGDACYQALAYWIMSALTNDAFTLARFAGIYKAMQSAVSKRCYVLFRGCKLGSGAGIRRKLRHGRRRDASVERTREPSFLLPCPHTDKGLLQLASWIMMLASFPLAFVVIRSIKETNYNDEQMVYVDDVKKDVMEQGGEEKSPEAGSIEKASISGAVVAEIPAPS